MGKSLVLGERNTSSLAAGASGLPIQITYNFGGLFRVMKVAIFYLVNIDFALVTLKDTQNNRDVISGNTVLASVATPVSPGTFRRINYIDIEPIDIANGQSVQLFLNNITAVALSPNELSLTLYGVMI
jgi:hypothetical protein